MTKPQREPGARRQWGVINDILKSSSQESQHSQSAHRTEDTRNIAGRAHTRGADGRQSRLFRNKPHGQRRTSQHAGRSGQSASNQQNQCHSDSLQDSYASRLDQTVDRSHHRSEQCYDDQRWSRSPQAVRQRDRSIVQSHAAKPIEKSKESSMTPRSTDLSIQHNQTSPGKRKRAMADDGKGEARTRPTKKQHIVCPEVEQPKQPLSRQYISQKPVAPNSSTPTTILTINSQNHSVIEGPSQLLTPPSSNGSPECEITSEQLLKTNCVSTFRANCSKPSSGGVKADMTKKRQRDEDVGPHDEPKRLRHLKATSPAKPLHQSVVGPLSTSQRRRPALQVQARAVRPDSSFAPVTPNHACELTFLEYLHDSVPILYSSMIKHSRDASLLNSPSGTLVVNALAIIGPSVDPRAKRGWPSTIELPGRTPGHTGPVKILSDVDLYLHIGENEFCVATDRGLLAVAAYLDIIGVPKTQPVRFEGCVPSWARATFRTPGRRRIMLPKDGKDPRKFEVVSKGAALGTHQIALTLESHVEVTYERQNLEAWEREAEAQVQVASDREPAAKSFTHGRDVRQRDGNGYPIPQLGEMLILSADIGHLPLRAGSVVLVYAVDDDYNWAYGRLSGTDKMGRFPITHTCPVDWSLDRLAKTDDNLKLPFTKSDDPDEQDWRGPYHWLRQGGYALGPTWKETLEAGAAKARDDKARNLATSRVWRSNRVSPSLGVTSATTKQATSPGPSSNKLSPSPATTACIATSYAPMDAVGASMQGLMPVLLNSGTEEGAKQIQDEGSHAMISTDGARPTEGTPSTEIERKVSLVAVQIDDAASAPKNEQPEPVGADVECQKREEEKHVDKDVDTHSSITKVSVGDEYGENSAEAGVCTKIAASDGVSAVVAREVEGKLLEGPYKVTTGIAVTPMHQNSFAKPRLDQWARNDDIEYDWGDSDEEL